MFVATANTMNIPAPLLDRMEIIRLAGYTEDEKINIAMKYLLPKELKTHGLKPVEVSISEAVIRDIVRYYTREAGVRRLEQEIAKICRKVVKELLLNQTSAKKVRRATDVVAADAIVATPKKVSVTSKNLEKYLGVYRYDYGIAAKENQV